jgi:hypothetical protein
MAESVCIYRPGTVVRYTPDPSRHDPRWCREGYAIADSDGVLLDTYWQSGGDSHRLLPVELATVEVLFHLDDYDELDRYSKGSPPQWQTYHPNDRRRITSQHGLQARWFVRKGATPDLSTQIANAEDKVREAEDEVRCAQQRLDWKRQDLAALIATPAPRTPESADERGA